jgi:hypothetical protein
MIVFLFYEVRLSPFDTAATSWPIVLVPDDDNCGAIGGMQVGRGNQSTWKSRICPLFQALKRVSLCRIISDENRDVVFYVFGR